MQNAEEIERINRKKYEEDYSIAQVSIAPDQPEGDYFRKLTEIRLGLIAEHGQNKKVLDIACGSGDYLFASKDIISEGIGIDFSRKTIKEAVFRRDERHLKDIDFLVCSATALPLEEKTFELIYSFSALYYMPKVKQVIAEIARLLKPGSIAILELGNLTSLNTLVGDAYPELAISCHIRTRDMRKFIKNAGLEIIQWRAFQILPLWGNRPRWLRPLLNWRWKRWLAADVRGKMLDEWISSMPLLRHLAFRHIIVCRKRT